MMLQRSLKKGMENGLLHSPVVAILGSRQVGKTTLALGITKRSYA
jgi:predicted AAA+ superfamily ATPase